ncbi:phenylalanyl-tRNA synthetase alpha subunit, mitochondrial [Hanseniaspora vineae]
MFPLQHTYLRASGFSTLLKSGSALPISIHLKRLYLQESKYTKSQHHYLSTQQIPAQEEAILTVSGKAYERDAEQTNVPQAILDLTDRQLHLNPKHPLGVLRSLIEKKLNSVDQSFETYNDFKPAVSVFENFDSLGFPKDHPGRNKSDTYYINRENLLRTHTSAHEMECFGNILQRKTQKPGYLITADVYRRDEIDKTHYPAFHQMEGARIWSKNAAGMTQLQKDIEVLNKELQKIKNFTVEDCPYVEATNPKQSYMSEEEVHLVSTHLKKTFELIVAEVFKKKLESEGKGNEEIKARWIEAYFPWTAPSWEIEVWWNGEWLELCGCGLVREQVFLNAGMEKDSTIGWAFGLGLDRIAMLLFGIPDIRLFWTKDPRFHEQFKENTITTFKPYSKYPGTVRDVSFWKNPDLEIHENDLMEIVRSNAGDLVESVKLIDSFVHPKTQKHSLCYRINYQSMDRNITNEEINELQEVVRNNLVERYGVKLR